MLKLSTQDALFLTLESPEAPMHIGALITCRLPTGARGNFMQELHTRLARSTAETEPFNLRLVEKKGSGKDRLSWERADKIDLEYHLRHEALPWPGGERELGLAVSRLHSIPLERSRPLWEFTLIEGLHPARFALYLKVHHALSDGVGMLGRITAGMAESPRGTSLPPWAAPSPFKKKPPATQSADDDWQKFFAELLGGLVRPRTRPRSAPLIPRGPRCVLNGDTTSRRRVATQQISLARVKALARAADATVNDVVLAVCAGALRAYLAEFDRLPRDPLLASVPVALPRGDDATIGNAVASIHTAIATNLREPRRRLLAIRDAMRGAKEEFRIMPVSLHRVINSLGMQAMMMVPKRRNTDPERAAFTNLTISNVPGPVQRLYFAGGEIDGMYPLSLLTGDHRLNITVLSYREQLHFGLVACPDTLPSVQYLAVQLPAALRELEVSMARARSKRRGAQARQRSKVS